jgi:hypothetical protein
MANEKGVCAGLFGPCSNPPDPKFLLEDPDGKGPPIERCRFCAEAGDELLQRVINEGKLERLDFEIEAARLSTSTERGKG